MTALTVLVQAGGLAVVVWAAVQLAHVWLDDRQRGR